MTIFGGHEKLWAAKKPECTVHSAILNPSKTIFKQLLYNSEAVPSHPQENRVGESSIITQ